MSAGEREGEHETIEKLRQKIGRKSKKFRKSFKLQKTDKISLLKPGTQSLQQAEHLQEPKEPEPT
jgi:hypothetical protein